MFVRTFCSIVAAGSLAAAVGCSKPTADDHLRKGDGYVAESRLPEAILEYRLALQADPQRGDVRTRLADASMKNGDAPTALREYVRAADLLPDDSIAQLRAGEMLLLSGSFEDAKTRATRLLEIEPKSVDGQILLGNALAGLKDWDAAVDEFQEAVALNPAGDTAYVNIGSVQAVRGNQAEAEVNFRRAVEVAPQSVRARLALANFLWSSGRAPEAEETLKGALALEPGNAVANRALGIFYFVSNRAADAEPFFQRMAATAKTADAKLALSDYYAALHRFDDARKVLQELSGDEASYAIATTRLAALDVAEGQRALALAKVRAVTGKFPNDLLARLLTARILVLDGDRVNAMAEARAIVDHDPQSRYAASAYLVIGEIETYNDRRDDAVRAYEEVLKRQPRSLPAAIKLAALHLAGGSLEKAGVYARQAAAIAPASAEVRAVSVRILLAERNVLKAKAEIAALQRDYPRSPTVLNLVAGQQVVEGRTDNAYATYLRVLEVAPDDFEALTGTIAIDLENGRAKQAVDRVEARLDAPRPAANVLVLAARTHATAGDGARAEALLTQAIELEPERLAPYSMLGQLYARQGRVDRAITQFQEVLKRNPRSVPANTMLGMLFEMQQKLPEAEAQYKAALAVDATAPVAANNLAWIYAAGNRNMAEALELARSAQQALPDDPNVNDTLGWIYYKRNMTQLAIRHLQSGAARSRNPAILYHLGMAYMQGGELEKARKHLEQALASKTAFEGSAEAQQALAKLAP